MAYITNARRDVRDQMNGYIPNFKASETYADLVERANAEEFVPNTDIPQVKDGEVLRVAINTGGSGYPYTYYDFVTEEPQGVDIEFIKHFAAEYGYTIEWFDSSWDAALWPLPMGKWTSSCMPSPNTTPERWRLWEHACTQIAILTWIWCW